MNNKNIILDRARFLRAIICLPILFYKWLISPILQPCCRFYPTCSQYALIAIKNHGVIKGLWLTLLRLFRCHPWSKSHGYDPVKLNQK